MTENVPLETLADAGVITAMPTFFHEDGNVDHDRMHQLIDDQIDAGVGGLAFLVTTSQSTLIGDVEDRIGLAERFNDYVKGRVPVIIGAGNSDTRVAAGIVQGVTEAIGPTTFLCDSGDNLKLGNASVIRHYEVVGRALEAAGSTGIVYNNPGRKPHNISLHASFEIGAMPMWIGEKEASGNLDQVREKISVGKSHGYLVMSGEDDQVYEIMELGGVGVISGSASIAPQLFVRLVKAGKEAQQGHHEGWERVALYQAMISGPKIRQGLVDGAEMVTNPKYAGLFQAVFPDAKTVIRTGFIEGTRFPSPMTLNWMFGSHCRTPLDVPIPLELQGHVRRCMGAYTQGTEMLDMTQYAGSPLTPR